MNNVIGMFVLEFNAPVKGLDLPAFNTFRLGLTYSKRLKRGDSVLLIDKRAMQVAGIMTVSVVMTGTLQELAERNAMVNHNWFEHPDAAKCLVESMIKRYGPHKCNEDSKVTVLYLRR